MSSRTFHPAPSEVLSKDYLAFGAGTFKRGTLLLLSKDLFEGVLSALHHVVQGFLSNFRRMSEIEEGELNHDRRKIDRSMFSRTFRRRLWCKCRKTSS